MLIKIREKSQGVFAWVILLLICVPFALWGIQNYVGGGTEAAVVTIGESRNSFNEISPKPMRNLARILLERQLGKMI